MHRSISLTLCSALLLSSRVYAQARAEQGRGSIVPPRVVRVIEPQFPGEMQGRTASVAVGLILDIDTSGRVSSASIAQSSQVDRLSTALGRPVSSVNQRS